MSLYILPRTISASVFSRLPGTISNVYPLSSNFPSSNKSKTSCIWVCFGLSDFGKFQEPLIIGWSYIVIYLVTPSVGSTYCHLRRDGLRLLGFVMFNL
nr:MAG TPA: hypothetical protein [Caudoviricetes sp.]